MPPTIWSYNDAVKDYDYNPEKAKELLKQAGIDRARGLGAVARAHAVNQGKSRGDELLPSF